MITYKFIDSQRKKFRQDSYNLTLQHDVTKNGLEKTIFNDKCDVNKNIVYDVILEKHEVMSQGASGRCWMFAGLNYMRHLYEKANGSTIKLSAAYLYFYDLLEKSNYFLEHMIQYRNISINDRVVQFFLDKPIQDSGQWSMFWQLINKYGVVREGDMPENIITQDTRLFVDTLCDVLRIYASQIRKSKLEYKELEKLKKEMLVHVYKILAIGIGEPPDKIEYQGKSVSPQKYFKQWKINEDKFISIVNIEKTEAKNRRYELVNVGNMVEGDSILYYEFSVEKIKKMVIKQLNDKEAVWFGCDSKICFDREKGIMDMNLFEFNNFFELPRKIEKEVCLDYHISAMNHAMIFVGYKILKDGSYIWCVENSTDNEHGGYCMMSDEWFEQYVFQVVIKDKYVIEEQFPIDNFECIKMQPWSPLGTLAMCGRGGDKSEKNSHNL